eukprot:g616.t1
MAKAKKTKTTTAVRSSRKKRQGKDNAIVVTAVPVVTSKKKGKKKNSTADASGGRQVAWEMFLSALKAYKKREGDCKVPQKHKEGDYALGKAVSHVRCNERYIRNDPSRRKALENMQFDFRKTQKRVRQFKAQWSKFKKALDSFHKKHKHCNVPFKHKENGYNLGRNVSEVRVTGQYVRNNPERKKELDSMGFPWTVAKKEKTEKQKKGKK